MPMSTGRPRQATMAHARTRDATRRERWRHPGGRLVLLLGLIGLAGPHTCLAQGQPVFPRIDQVSGKARLVREAEAPGPLPGTVVKRGEHRLPSCKA